MNQHLARARRLFVDLGALSIAYWLAWAIRFDWAIPMQQFKQAMFLWAWVIALQFLSLATFDVSRFSWRHVGLKEATRILQALGAAGVVLVLIRLLAGAVIEEFGYARYAVVPFGVIAANLPLAFLLTVGVRATWRMRAEAASAASRDPGAPAVPTLLIGAGSAGVEVARELGRHPQLGIDPVGFLDDDPAKLGSLVHGLPVLGSTADLTDIASQHSAEQALITIANAHGADIRRIKTVCDAAGLPARIVPPIYEIVDGSVSIAALRDVAIEDLLGRAPVVLDQEAIARVVSERVVLVTGAGGSIGSELSRQIARFGPARLILFERAESSLFAIERDLRLTHPQVELVPCLGDILDSDRLGSVFAAQTPDVVFHTAAHKHVPLLEQNPGEAVRNNVLGSRAVADAAHDHGVHVLVNVSTDKAVNPASIMGACKRLAELYIQALSGQSSTRFVTVRFGNVLGSAGSVVPLFKAQIAAGGPVTVTHPEMERYFMTIPEACQLILQSAALGKGGEIFVLDMGEQVRIVDLARDLIRLSGLKPDVDIDLVFTGVRPGEKLQEELTLAAEHADTTLHPKILRGQLQARDYGEVSQQIDVLARLVARDGTDGPSIRRHLSEMVAEFAASPPPGPLPSQAPRTP